VGYVIERREQLEHLVMLLGPFTFFSWGFIVRYLNSSAPKNNALTIEVAMLAVRNGPYL
jgi:hypothetical protein